MNQKAKVTYELKTEKGIVCSCSNFTRSNKAYASLLKGTGKPEEVVREFSA